MKPSYQYIFDLLDFADTIARRIVPGEFENGSYFMTLVYVEDILDKYGRGFVREAALEVGKTEDEARLLMSEAYRRMELLRSTIARLVQEFDFNATLDAKADQFRREWHR